MFKRIITQMAKDKALSEQASKIEKEAFTQGYALYKKITATQASKKAATPAEINKAMDLLEQGKHVPEAGGEKGSYRKYLGDLNDVLESKDTPKF